MVCRGDSLAQFWAKYSVYVTGQSCAFRNTAAAAAPLTALQAYNTCREGIFQPLYLPGRKSMRKSALIVVAVCLLIGTVALAQTAGQQPSSSRPSASQQRSPNQQPSRTQPPSSSNPGSSSSQQNPDQTQPGQSPQSSSSASSSASPTGNPDQPAANNPERAASRPGGIPWLWIVLGAVILLIVIIALASRRAPAADTRIERIDEHRHDHDDIRRVG